TSVFGLSGETLFRDGVLVPSVFVLSHEEQRERIRRTCPEALPAAVVAGDPTFDRLLAGRRWREDYRAALGAADGRRLILVSTTWGPTSLLGRFPEVLPRLLRELPADEYRVVFVAHPNAWHGHGIWQMRSWLASCERAGLVVLPPRSGWQAALVAADHVIGDHGSVTFYGAALGTHTMLGAFPHEDLDPDSPIAAFGRAAALLDEDRPLADQLAEDAARHRPDRFAACTSQLTSVPGGSAAALRTLMYRLMELDEPAGPVRTLPPETPAPVSLPRPAQAGIAPLLVTAEGDAAEVRVRRFPAEPCTRAGTGPAGGHLLVDASEPEPRWYEGADVLVRPEPAPRPGGLGRAHPVRARRLPDRRRREPGRSGGGPGAHRRDARCGPAPADTARRPARFPGRGRHRRPLARRPGRRGPHYSHDGQTPPRHRPGHGPHRAPGGPVPRVRGRGSGARGG